MFSISRLKNISLIITCACYVISCSKDDPDLACFTPPNDELIIVLEDSAGNNLLEQMYPNLVIYLIDSVNTLPIESSIVYSNNTAKRAWQFNIQQLLGAYPYLLEYDSSTIDTLTVNWSLEETVCGENTYYCRRVQTVRYNDTTLVGGGFHVVIK